MKKLTQEKIQVIKDSGLFDAAWYSKKYRDVAATGLDPLDHFLRIGIFMDRKPGPNLNQEAFRELPLAAANPSLHLIKSEQNAKQLVAAGDISNFNSENGSDFIWIPVQKDNNPEIPSLRLHDDRDFSIKVPFKFENKVKIQKVAVIAHIFYTDALEEILKYLNNIPSRVDLFISTDTEDKKCSIVNDLKNYSNGIFEVRVFENRGRDIAPMLCGFNDVFSNYDYFLHIHGKKSPHGGSLLSDWRLYLFETLLGSKDIVNSIFNVLTSDENIGLVFPQHFRDLRGCINWGYNYQQTKNLLAKASISINSNLLLEFPSGSMFWARSAAIKKLLDIRLSSSDFPIENGQIDGTLAHAIERSLLYFCEAAGYKWLKISNESISPIKHTLLSVGAKATLEDCVAKVYRPLFNKYESKSKLEKSIPEVSKIKFYPSYVKKPRLNLLINTINESQSFGGVATAIKFFYEMAADIASFCDLRIIVLDAYIDEKSKRNFNSYTFANLKNSLECEFQNRVVIDAFDRTQGYLYIRESDFFICTAWWTAYLHNDVKDFQSMFFSKHQKMIYLIQDYESNFYNWSSKWALCESTYTNLVNGNCIAIFNSEELAEFMIKKYGFSINNSYFIPYNINNTLKNNYVTSEKQKSIIFYGRPSVTRNLFELLIDGIKLWQSEEPLKSKEWNIYSLGEDYPLEMVSDIKNIKVIGKASSSEYSDMLNRCSIGISLMLSPHPSYPPLEMASYNILTITNRYDNKNLYLRNKNLINIDNFSAESISEKISYCVSKFNECKHNAISQISHLSCELAPLNIKSLINLIDLKSN